MRVPNYFSTHHYIYFSSYPYFMSILTQISCFIWSICMPKFFTFPQNSTSTYKVVLFGCLRNSISGRGKANWKKFYQHITVLSFTCFSIGSWRTSGFWIRWSARYVKVVISIISRELIMHLLRFYFTTKKQLQEWLSNEYLSTQLIKDKWEN